MRLEFEGIYVALGSNIGDRTAMLDGATRALDDGVMCRVIARSTTHETKPLGGPAGQSWYLNAVLKLETTLDPRALLAHLLAIESRFGRVRGAPCAPRTLDLDLLLYHALVIRDAELVLPHPRMWERTFVLEPLAEICDVAFARAQFAVSAALNAACEAPNSSCRGAEKDVRC